MGVFVSGTKPEVKDAVETLISCFIDNEDRCYPEPDVTDEGICILIARGKSQLAVPFIDIEEGVKIEVDLCQINTLLWNVRDQQKEAI